MVSTLPISRKGIINTTDTNTKRMNSANAQEKSQNIEEAFKLPAILKSALRFKNISNHLLCKTRQNTASCIEEQIMPLCKHPEHDYSRQPLIYLWTRQSMRSLEMKRSFFIMIVGHKICKSLLLFRGFPPRGTAVANKATVNT